MTKVVPINKQSKKNQKNYNKQNRVVSGFNTGTRTMKTIKNPSRSQQKTLDRREWANV